MKAAWYAFVPLVAAAATVFAADGTIRVNRVAPYTKSVPDYEEAIKSCPWNRELNEHVIEYSDGLVEATDADLTTLPGRTLRISILHMRAAKGGGFSGPKWGAIRAELYEDGKLIGRYNRYRRTMTPFGSYCGSLSKVADALGADIAGWLKRGQFTAVEPIDDSVPEIGPPENVPPIQ